MNAQSFINNGPYFDRELCKATNLGPSGQNSRTYFSFANDSILKFHLSKQPNQDEYIPLLLLPKFGSLTLSGMV